jgi:hypothetical protein
MELLPPFRLLAGGFAKQVWRRKFFIVDSIRLLAGGKVSTIGRGDTKKHNISTESYVLQWFGQHLKSIVHEIIRFTTIFFENIPDDTPEWNPPPVAGKVTLAALEALKPV